MKAASSRPNSETRAPLSDPGFSHTCLQLGGYGRASETRGVGLALLVVATQRHAGHTTGAVCPPRVPSGRAQLVAASLLLLAALMLGACKSGEELPWAPGSSVASRLPSGASRCTIPNQGCPCEADAAPVECGETVAHSGDSFTCSSGLRTCINGAWGPCSPYRTTQKLVGRSGLGSAPGTRLLALGVSSACPAGFDPCNPYCNVVTDVADDTVPLPAGLKNGTTGVTLVANGSGNCADFSLAVNSPNSTTMTITALSGSPLPVAAGQVNPVGLTATGMGPNCSGSAFDTTWTIDKFDRATISGDKSNNGSLTLAAAIAGTVRVTAYALGTSHCVDLTVKVNVLDTVGVAPDAAGTTQASNFSSGGSPLPGTTASTATWLYPYADTYFPLGMLPPVIQYKYSTAVGAGITPAVKATLRYPVGSTVSTAKFNYALIVKELNAVSHNAAYQPTTPIPSTIEDPQVVIPPAAWSLFEKTARSDDASLVIQRYRGGATNPLERETTRNIHFVDGQLKGKVYYKSYNSHIAGSAVASATGAVLKIDPTASAPSLAISASSGHCTTCHTVSAQGNSMIVNSGGFGFSADAGVCSGAALSWDTAWSTNTYLDNGCSFNLSTMTQIKTYKKGTTNQSKFDGGAPYPNGSFYLSNVWDDHSGFNPSPFTFALQPLYRVSDGAAVTSAPSPLASSLTGAPALPVSPAFSPDGRAVAYNEGWAIVISEINPCNKFDGTAGEGIELRNDSPVSLSVDGWTVKNGSGTVCRIVPASTTLASGNTVRYDLSVTCLGDTTDTVSLFDAGGTKRFSYAYSYAASSCGTATGTVKGSVLSCPRARNWSTKAVSTSTTTTCSPFWPYFCTTTTITTGTADDTSNDSCGGLASPVSTAYCGSSTANTYVTGNLLKAKDFDCGAASGSVDCGSGAWSFSNEKTVVDCTSAGCVTAGFPSFLPDGTGILYQHMTAISQDACSALTSMNGARSQIWLTSKSQPFAPILLKALNGLDSSGTNYLPTVPRDVSTPKGFCNVSYNNAFHAVSGATNFVYLNGNPAGTQATTVKENELNYFPNVSPQEAGGKFWVIFASRRLYGNIATANPWQAELYTDSCGFFPSQYGPNAFIETKKLWIAAIDKDWSGSADPSHPAFYLPGQELTAGNSHGYWSATPCAELDASCDTNDDCCHGTDSPPTRVCKVVSTTSFPPTKQCASTTSCSAAGAACTATDNCCTGLVCPTGGGVCMNLSTPIYTPQTLTREFVAKCPEGTLPSWTYLDWQATIPTGTRIDFSAQTKLLLGDTYAPAAPALVATATATTASGIWASASAPVDTILKSVNQTVGPFLLVSMKLSPDSTGQLSPSLGQWRVLYDCLPTL